MRKQSSGARKRPGFATAALAAALLLSACGSDNDDRHDPAPPPAPAPGPTPAPAPAVDAFFAFVLARVSSLLDTDEPVAIDAVTVTTPDNTEPEALQ